MDWVLLGIPAGVIMLYLGSEWLVDGAKNIAKKLGIPAFVIGLTVLAFGSSAPECITSIVSQQTPDIIIGNVVGSNITNITLCLGLAAAVAAMPAVFKDMRFELYTMIFSTLILMAFGFNGYIELYESIVLCALLFVFVYLVYRLKKNDKEGQKAYVEDVDDDDAKVVKTWLCLVKIIVGLVLLYYGARFFVDGAVDLAHMLNVSELLIGLVVVAIGTSLPELCISVIASYRGENELAIANIVGSNIFNAFFVLGVGGLLVDVPISGVTLQFHMIVMLAISILLFAIVKWKGRLSRGVGFMFLAIYVIYTAAMIMMPTLTM